MKGHPEILYNITIIKKKDHIIIENIRALYSSYKSVRD